MRDDLLDKIESIDYWQEHFANKTFMKALLAVVELHNPVADGGCGDLECCGLEMLICADCPTYNYPCPTIQAIQKVLQ